MPLISDIDHSNLPGESAAVRISVLDSSQHGENAVITRQGYAGIIRWILNADTEIPRVTTSENSAALLGADIAAV